MSFFKKLGKKKAFKGEGRTVGDLPPPKPAPASKETEMTPIPTKSASQNTDDLPGPGNRHTQVTSTPTGTPGKPPPKTSDSDYKLKTADLVGTKKEEPTFAKKAPKAVSKIVKIKFDIRVNGQNYKVDAQFQISEPASAIFDYLESEIFKKVPKYEVIQPFPRVIIERDDKTLGSLKITGAAMLQVLIEGKASLKI